MSKKLFLVLFVAVLTVNYAQAQLTYGLRTGINLTNVYQNEDGDVKGLNWKGGFQFGVVAEYALLEDLFIQSGILFSQQGMQTDMSAGSIYVNYAWKLNYLQVPINFQYRNQSGNKYLQVGPYFGYGIGGKLTVIASSGGTSASESEKIKFGSKGNSVYNFKAFDFGLGAGAGFLFGNLQAGIGLNYGLANIVPNKNVSLKNLGLALTATYMFSK